MSLFIGLSIGNKSICNPVYFIIPSHTAFFASVCTYGLFKSAYCYPRLEVGRVCLNALQHILRMVFAEKNFFHPPIILF